MKKGRSVAQKIDPDLRKSCGNHQDKNCVRIIRLDKFSQEKNTELEKVLVEFHN